MLNVSDPFGALCLSRAPPAGRGEIDLALLTMTRARRSHAPTTPPYSVLRTPYSTLPRPYLSPMSVRSPDPTCFCHLLFHLRTGRRPICTFALSLFGLSALPNRRRHRNRREHIARKLPRPRQLIPELVDIIVLTHGLALLRRFRLLRRCQQRDGAGVLMETFAVFLVQKSSRD